MLFICLLSVVLRKNSKRNVIIGLYNGDGEFSLWGRK